MFPYYKKIIALKDYKRHNKRVDNSLTPIHRRKHMTKSTADDAELEKLKTILWQAKEQPSSSAVEDIAKEIGVLPVVARVLLRRGLKNPAEVRAFLQPSLENLLDPFLMFGVEEAATRLLKAVKNKELIVVMGDYDVDGITSCALLVDFLKICHAKVEGFVPNRFVHGHGLGDKAVTLLIEKQARLVVTVDHGISAAPQIAKLQAAKIDTIVTDHHVAPQKIPPGIVVDPNLPQCKYPFKHLAGCGVVFKLMCALRSLLRRDGFWDDDKIPRLREYLDLVALGTIADMVELNGENRILVYHGLRELSKQNRAGIAALLSTIRIEPKNGMLNGRDISFVIAPRINAAGRMQDAQLGLELLLEDNPKKANLLANKLDKLNTARREIEKQNFSLALKKITAEGLNKNPALVVIDKFHQGVLGILANRLVNHFEKPSLVFTLDNQGNYKGSSRGLPGYNVHAATAAAERFTLNMGGHIFASGCLVAADQLDEFTKIFTETCAEQASKSSTTVNLFEETLNKQAINLELAEQINSLAPFGNGNENPCFLLDNEVLPSNPTNINERHLKWTIGPKAEMIAWNQYDEWHNNNPDHYYVQTSVNEFRGQRKILLTVNEMQSSSKPANNLSTAT